MIKWPTWLLLVSLLYTTYKSCYASTACAETDSKCSFYASQEYDAIKWLHAYLDDDKDGEIDPMESAEFLVSELEKNSREVSSKQTSFHQNDTHISVDELWQIWIHSTPHNWTTDDVVRWLETVVELPEYVEVFREQEIKGSTLPLIAANWNYFVSTILHVRNPIHKRKLIIKAQDAILFGAPTISTWITTVLLELLAASLVVGITFFVFYRRHSVDQIEKLKHELDHLKQAESALGEMQRRLDSLQLDHLDPSRRNTITSTDSPMFTLGAPVELRRLTSVDLDDARREAERIGEERRATEEKLRRLELAEEELEQLRDLLAKMEHDMEISNGIKHPDMLEQLLISTYQIESRWLESRLLDAQRRMTSAKEACEKMGRKQSHIFGILRVSHSTLTDVDRTVLEARSALDAVRADVEERVERWAKIEDLTGFHILNNQTAMLKQPMQRYGSAMLRSRPSGVFESPSAPVNLSDLNTYEEDNQSLASMKFSVPNLSGEQTPHGSLLHKAVTASSSLASSSTASRASRPVLTRESRRDSWLSSDQSGSKDSANENVVSSAPHLADHTSTSSPSSSTAASSPSVASSSTPRRRQAP